MQGELTITIVEGRDLPVWGFPWQSNPYCRIVIGSQAVDSKRERETGSRGSFRCPNWNQEFQFLVEDSPMQMVKVTVYDSPYTGRVDVGYAQLRLDDLPQDGSLHKWLPVFCAPTYTETQGELFVRASYRAFDEVADQDVGEAVAEEGQPTSSITDVQSAAEASARAAVEASQGLEALAVAKAAAARAAARLRGRRESDSESSSSGEEVEGGSEWPPAPPTSALASLDTDSRYAERLVRAVRGQQARRDQQAEALATELGQRAVARVTGKSTPPTDQATLKKRVDSKIAEQGGASRRQEADEDTVEPAAQRDMAQLEAVAAATPQIPNDVSYARTHVDFDLVGEVRHPPRSPAGTVSLVRECKCGCKESGHVQGDGATSSMSEVKSTHMQQAPEERRGRTPPLLPGGLPGPQGRVLDELMVREATTRVRPVDTAELASINSPPESAGDGALPGGPDSAREGRPDGKRVVVADGKGQVIHPELSIQSDSAMVSADLERIVEVLPRGAAVAEPPSNYGRCASAEDSGDVRRNGAVEQAAAQPAQPARSAAGSVPGEPHGQALLEKTVDLEDGSGPGGDTGRAATEAAGKPEGKPEGTLDDQSRPWWKFGWGAEDSFTEQGPSEEELAKRKNQPRQESKEVASRAAGAEEQGEGEFWGWAKGMAILAGLRQRQDPQATSKEGAEGAEKDAKASGKAAQEGRGDGKDDNDSKDRQWWDVVGLLEALRREEAPKAEASAAGKGDRKAEDRALSTVIVSPDVPIEEIAAEIARVKHQQSERSDEQKRREGEDMLKGPVGQLQRLSRYMMSLNKPEIVLLCGLCGGVMVLLAVVAYRIELYMELIRALDAWR